MNRAYENFADPEGGFTQKEGLWVRVRREGSQFFLYATYDTTDWKQIQPVSLKGTPIGYFRLPELENNLVYAGFSVVGVDRGAHIQTATFDNITLEVFSSNTKQSPANGINSGSTPRVRISGSTVKVPAGTNVLKAEVFGAMGRRVGTLIREGNDYIIPDHGNLSAGLYRIRIQLPDGAVSIPYVKN